MLEEVKKERFARRPGWAKGNSLPLHGNFPGAGSGGATRSALARRYLARSYDQG
jgi:hypothetical protein